MRLPNQNESETHAGRTVKVNNIYRLPGDQAELERLSLEHQLLRDIWGGSYPCDPSEINDVLPVPSPPDGRRPQVLDIGSGSGLWASQMAMEFPHANIVGVDIYESQPAHIPQNCTFETGDITRGLSRYYNSFDLVHCRCMTGAVREYPVLVRELWKCLRPGGMIVTGEGDLQVYNEQKVLAEFRKDNDDDPMHSWLARLLHEVLSLIKRRSATSIGWDLKIILQDDGGFKNVNYKRRYVPIGWAGDGSIEHGKRVGFNLKIICCVSQGIQTLACSDCFLAAAASKDFVRAWRPLLLVNGFPAEKVDMWIHNIDVELDNPSLLRQYNVWHYAWAYKRDDAIRQ